MIHVACTMCVAILISTPPYEFFGYPFPLRARQVAGKVPSRLISDGAVNFAEAHHDMYAPLWKDSVHESYIPMAGDINNNQMESFNGNTIRMREKVTRGLKREDLRCCPGCRFITIT